MSRESSARLKRDVGEALLFGDLLGRRGVVVGQLTLGPADGGDVLELETLRAVDRRERDGVAIAVSSSRRAGSLGRHEVRGG